MFWQHFTPKHLLSRLTGRLAESQIPWLKDRLIQTFIHHYSVDMSIAQEPNPVAYPSFNAFFTRALKAEARPIASGSDILVSPVDGCVSQVGNIHSGALFQAKGHHFSCAELLGAEQHARIFDQGRYITLYLSPKDYHRIHMPVTGRLKEMVYIPGKLFSVNPRSAAKIPQLFARNERVVALFETELGDMAVVLVGAMIVASIETVWAGKVTPAKTRQITSWRYQDQKIILSKGEEMGRFLLGSTVILLFSTERLVWEASLEAGSSMILGQRIARV